MGADILLCFAGFAAWALAMDRHRADAWPEAPPASRLVAPAALRWAGGVVLTASLFWALARPTSTAALAAVIWVGALTLGAIAVVAVLTWRPRWLPAMAMAGALLGAALLLFSSL